MMKTMLMTLAIVLLVGALVEAAPLEVQDFETHTLGNTLDQEGWIGLWVVNHPANWSVVTPYGTGNTSSNAARVAGANSQIVRPFGANPGYTDASGEVYYSAWMQPLTAGGSPQPFRAGVIGSGPTFGPLFGIWVTSGTAYFELVANGTHVSAVSPTLAHWYELRLQIAQDADNIANSTGTLYVRDVTAGETAYTAIADLTDVNLGLTAASRPATWDQWYLRGQYNTQVDNLATGLGAIPEPATVMLLGCGALLAICRRK